MIVARKKARITHKLVGEKIGVPQPTISRIERKPDRTTVRTLKRIAEALSVDVNVYVERL